LLFQGIKTDSGANFHDMYKWGMAVIHVFCFHVINYFRIYSIYKGRY
jgi:hypothetical protein